MSGNASHIETIVLHAGHRADPTTGSVAVPIHQTTSFQFQNAEHAANLFALKELGPIYTRIGNPTVDVFEQRVAAMEGGAAALSSALATCAPGVLTVNVDNGFGAAAAAAKVLAIRA